jgi:hypothetical protein
VAVKTNVKGEKYVLVNEYRSKEDYSYWLIIVLLLPLQQLME